MGWEVLKHGESGTGYSYDYRFHFVECLGCGWASRALDFQCAEREADDHDMVHQAIDAGAIDPSREASWRQAVRETGNRVRKEARCSPASPSTS